MDSERKVQNKVIDWLEDLGYKYLGNLTKFDNTPIKENLLRENLLRRGYEEKVIKFAVNEILTLAANQSDSLFAVNEKIYSLLRYGRQGIKNSAGEFVTVNYIDWKNISENDFFVAEEVSVLCRDGIQKKRPDLVFYVNGIALGVCELKNSAVSAGEGIRQMITNQKSEYISRFFSTAQLLLAGNESQGIFYGTIGTPEQYYLQWKEDKNATDNLSVEIKNLQGDNDNRLRKDIISLCHKERFFRLIHDFIIFDGNVKKVARHNQYFAITAAAKRIEDFFAGKGEETGGIIWDTQGSGKSLIMVWLTKQIREHINDSRVVIITDREELDDQIEGVFKKVGENIRRAKSCADLRDILNRYDDGIICSLIHKYGIHSGEGDDIEIYVKELLKNLPKDFKARGNIVAFIDECHRTNSGKLHKAVKTLMPDAFVIGFTGTPLLKSDKATSLETFGKFIHTYKFNEGVEDGIVLDLRYEARSIEQNLTSPDKIDAWFEEKTSMLTNNGKEQLKQTWATMKNLYSSKERLEKIVADIIFDMNLKPRLKSGRGTAMLVAGSIYEACKFWEIFQNQGFKKCAVVTSYIPSTKSVRTATSDPNRESEEEYKKKIYERMLDGKTPINFENDVKEKFKNRPDKMKLLIVVDKLLTGFDAPSATYIYIDKSMKNHELFQSICRVNRPDVSDKDFGYIIDYKDLFRSLQLAIADYTTEAFEGFDSEDIEGLIKNRFDEAKAAMENNLKSLEELISDIPLPHEDSTIITYFCDSVGEEEDKTKLFRRESLYKMTAALTRGFLNCCERLVSHYDYTENDVNDVRLKVAEYNKIKDMVKLASNDYVDLKSYESDMRYILDTYVRADDSKLVSNLGEMTLTEVLLGEKTTTPAELFAGLPGDDAARAEIIENNLYHEIVKKMGSNRDYYGKMSEKLQEIILQRKILNLTSEEYLRQVVELARAVFRPEQSEIYPLEIRGDGARQALYDYLNKDIESAVAVDNAVKNSYEPSWKENRQKGQKIFVAVATAFISFGYSQEDAENRAGDIIETVIKNRKEYDI